MDAYLSIGKYCIRNRRAPLDHLVRKQDLTETLFCRRGRHNSKSTAAAAQPHARENSSDLTGAAPFEEVLNLQEIFEDHEAPQNHASGQIDTDPARRGWVNEIVPASPGTYGLRKSTEQDRLSPQTFCTRARLLEGHYYTVRRPSA